MMVGGWFGLWELPFLGCSCHELLPCVHYDWHAGRRGVEEGGRGMEFSLRMRRMKNVLTHVLRIVTFVYSFVVL